MVGTATARTNTNFKHIINKDIGRPQLFKYTHFLFSENILNVLLDGLLQGLEVQDEKERVKLFKVYNPLLKPKAKYWDKKKDNFVCSSGSKKNFNSHITDVLLFL